MFRIRRIYDDILPGDKEIIVQVQNILRQQFSLLRERGVQELPDQLRNPVKYRFRSILFVADDLKGNIEGFSFLFHIPDLNICFLDYISAAKYYTGRGIGSTLYERMREEARSLKTIGLFFECLPDDPKLCPDPQTLKQNIARLRFYEYYGARPIINTKYETPVRESDTNPPYLVFDDLGQNIALKRDKAKEIVKIILERKYADVCSKEYVKMVVDSFVDDPVRLRPFRYIKEEKRLPIKVSIPADKRIVLVVNDKHAIHHVRERGYVEAPVRIKSILKYFDQMDLFERFEPKEFSQNYLKSVHDVQYIEYFKKMCTILKENESVYPYVFPLRNHARPPKELPIRAGYYCIDTFTPLSRNAYLAAKRAVDCSLTVAQKLLGGYRLGYALIRPPGHHAERKSFGGFCYFCSSAITAQYLSVHGKVAILDIDYHHGNGQEDIFYKRSDVLTVSIHGHPRFTYPFFSGFEDEKGEGKGKGYNVNIALPENIGGERYRQALQKAIREVKKFEPRFLVVALGFDTAKGDPTGTWNLLSKDFELNGKMIGGLRLPTIVVQEGGYNNRFLGINARSFFNGLWSGLYS